ncbi:MAG: S26 family signal peptidase [Acidimicrobiia bacterium]
MKRFAIAETSMLPSLQPGEEIVATNSREPRIGDVVVFPHPERNDFWMVKRRSPAPAPVRNEKIWVESDNQREGTVDSRSLGPIETTTVWTRVETLDATTFVEATQLLADEDDTFQRIIDRHGIPEFWHRAPGFRALVLLILEQQVSLESGAAMYRRLDDAAGDVSPSSVLSLGNAGLGAIGVTRQKSGYLMNLAALIEDGSFDLAGLTDLSVPEARDQLVALKGIGPWTADAYLLSALRHIDMWPVGDRALQVGSGEAIGMSRPPTEGELELLAEPWRPIRAAAARLIWHAYLTQRGRREPPDPTLTHACEDYA